MSKKTKYFKEKQRLLRKQKELFENLIRKHNEDVMSKRGWYGIYDKRGNLTI